MNKAFLGVMVVLAVASAGLAMAASPGLVNSDLVTTSQTVGTFRTGDENTALGQEVLLARMPGACRWVKKCVFWRNGICVKRKWIKVCPYPPFYF